MNMTLDQFGRKLAQENLGQAEMALAILWYLDRATPGQEATPSELGRHLHSLGLSGPVRASRLKQQIQRLRLTVVGSKRETLRLSQKGKAKLDSSLDALLPAASAQRESQTAVLPTTESSTSHQAKTMPTKAPERPSMFIGSSKEGLPIAEAIQINLDHDVECKIWSQGVFGLSSGTLETLVEASRKYDFATLVLTPDDLTTKRTQTGNSPRDNVLFELGLFIGALGRERAFMVFCRDEQLMLPTDLAGITPATFSRHSDGNLVSSVGALSTSIKNRIRSLGKKSSKA